MRMEFRGVGCWTGKRYRCVTEYRCPKCASAAVLQTTFDDEISDADAPLLVAMNEMTCLRCNYLARGRNFVVSSVDLPVDEPALSDLQLLRDPDLQRRMEAAMAHVARSDGFAGRTRRKPRAASWGPTDRPEDR